jgi:hypothetical protein
MKEYAQILFHQNNNSFASRQWNEWSLIRIGQDYDIAW